ncbi:AAA family ATPase [Clostridium magnum]|uniref:Uncharacterized protein n=1 Tax=Clostridium magnum DSM 2767 TaxID=1121326 RepID=A0A162SWN5_9CLOT|nr:hypothetical protein CLMAG_17670 [Clostridium magnum DSM 2767]SHH28290.1 AAA domain-containing protein [Clostridium magnum DSM 2767]
MLKRSIIEVLNFSKKHVRDLEYKVILDLASEALEFDSNVIINAPFSRELRDIQYIENLRNRLKEYDAKLRVIWIECSEETAHERMLKRNSDRDTWKLQHWEEYIKTENFNAPDIEDLLIYKNDNEEEEKKSFKEVIEKLKISIQK